MARAPWLRAPFPSYALTNIGANIRRARERIQELEAKAEKPPAETVQRRGFNLVEAPEENRVRLVFDAKPEAGVRALLKSEGFRWSPSLQAWQRPLNEAGRAAARRVIERLESDGEAVS